jgi:hypothetical protein
MVAAIALIALVTVFPSCGRGEHPMLSCVVRVGAAETTVPMYAGFGGGPVEATTGDYSVRFSIMDDARKYLAEVRHSGAPVWSMIGTAAAGARLGTSGTPDGLLEYGCVPDAKAS